MLPKIFSFFLLIFSNCFQFVSPRAIKQKESLLSEDSPISRDELEEVKELLQYMNMKLLPLRRASTENSSNVELDELVSRYSDLGLKQIKRDKQLLKNKSKLDDYLFQGDILLNKNQAEILAGIRNVSSTKNRRRRESYPANFQILWDKSKPILYTVSSMSPSVANIIRQVYQFWQKNTCLRFQETSPQYADIRFIKKTGRQSVNRSQEISIGRFCDEFGVIAHEIAHSLGFVHTQSRGDRDNHVIINFKNIQSNRVGNFMKEIDALESYRLTGYDYGSIMQYSPYAFAVDGSVPTVFARDWKYQTTMGQKDMPAFSDIKAMNLLYSCYESCSLVPSIQCQNGGYVNSNKCDTCVCPPQFTGKDCSKILKGSLPICNTVGLEATNTWKFFRGNFGFQDRNLYNYSKDCNFIIKAPAGKRVTIRFSFYTSGYCFVSCPFQSVEIQDKNFDLSGMRFCCPVTNVAITSQNNILSIRGIARQGSGYFDIYYMTS